MTIEITLLGGGMISGPMLLMLLILAMIARDKRGGGRERGSATEGKDKDHVD